MEDAQVEDVPPATPAVDPPTLDGPEPVGVPQALARVEPTPVVVAPRPAADDWALAQLASESKLFAGLNATQARFLIERARELGIGPATALAGMHFIQGKPAMSTDLMVGVVKARADLCRYFCLVESSATSATYETHRVGDPKPQRMTFTLEEAQAAGLAGKDMWKKWPRVMLRKRAAAFLCRDVYPDLFAGVYDPDELDSSARPGRTVDAEVVDAVDPFVARLRAVTTQDGLSALKTELTGLGLADTDPRKRVLVEEYIAASARVRGGR